MQDFDSLLGINKLVQIEHHATELLQRLSLQTSLHVGDFGHPGLPARGNPPREGDLLSGLVARLAFQTGGEVMGLGVDEVAVEEGESLRGDGGDPTLRFAAQDVGDDEG
ncbi:MAG: hypothetical protein U1F81_06030 [Verrucomicrobiaceae bacterium]